MIAIFYLKTFFCTSLKIVTSNDKIYDKTRYKIKYRISSCKSYHIYVIQSEERLTRYSFFVFASTDRLLYIIPVRLRSGFIPYETQNSIAKITDPFNMTSIPHNEYYVPNR